MVVLRNVLEALGEIHLVDKACNSLEVLVPWDVREVVIWGANRALPESVSQDLQGQKIFGYYSYLEENHPESRLKDL